MGKCIRNVNLIIYIFLLLNLTVACSTTQEKGLSGKVVSVTDGDTIKVELTNGHIEKVRLILIDTPETRHPQMGEQPFGKEASAFTASALSGKMVTLELDVEERDRYGRLLAYVWDGNTLFNELLLQEGLARVSVFPPNTKYLDRFNATQKEAQSSGIGIWSMEDYVQEKGFNQEVEEVRHEQNERKNKEDLDNESDDTELNIQCKGKIKGNVNSKIYHVPGGSYYSLISDNIYWFCTEEEAQKAGYRKSKR